MKVLVIGGGLIGLSSAYFLRRDGNDVTVIDRADGPGRECSFANGGLLTPGMAEPWNAPGCWRLLLKSLGRSDVAMQLRLRALPALAGWGIQFLRNSSATNFERNALSNLRLALHSLKVMHSLREETRIDYGHATSGSLKIFRSQAALDVAWGTAIRRLEKGALSKRLSAAETVRLEPTLAPIADDLAGSIHCAADESGDAYQFCVALADYAKEQGVHFRFKSEVTSLELGSGRVTAAICRQEQLIADRYVLAAGSYSTPLLRQVRVSLPVRPAKGYSVTIGVPEGHQPLSIPVIDDHWHAAVVPLKNAMRVAGTAEFAGYDLTLSQDCISNLMRLLHEILPKVQFDPTTVKPWCGLRPMSVDGVPIIGPTSIPNLWVNTGHGHLGWTMAAGSGQLLADLVSGKAPSINSAPYALTRF
jgi:D-amino-acid dehydrogenase